MFEKEAEEYANQSCFTEMPNPSLSEDIDISDEIKEAVLYGYNKANEWHKVSEEGLPINKHDGATYLLYTIYGEGGSPVVAHFMYRDKQELMNVWTGAILTEDKIIKWKEIILPKESE